MNKDRIEIPLTLPQQDAIDALVERNGGFDVEFGLLAEPRIATRTLRVRFVSKAQMERLNPELKEIFSGK